MAEREVWGRVRGYLAEIVPCILLAHANYQFGYAISRALLGMFYKVSVDYVRRESIDELPRESIVIYLLNHRSNADFVLASYLAGEVAISYAVGSGRASFRSSTCSSHSGPTSSAVATASRSTTTVLERYVQHDHAQRRHAGIFPEGGLTRDGHLRPPRWACSTTCSAWPEPGFAERMHVIPVAINYDRVLEDRTLLRELRTHEGSPKPRRLPQLGEVLHYAGWNAGRALSRRWKRYGRAAVVISGEPIPVKPWLDALAAGRERHCSRATSRDDLARCGRSATSVMTRIGAITPVTPVPLACAALQTFDADFMPRDRLLERMGNCATSWWNVAPRVLKGRPAGRGKLGAGVPDANAAMRRSWPGRARGLPAAAAGAGTGEASNAQLRGRHLCGEFRARPCGRGTSFRLTAWWGGKNWSRGSGWSRQLGGCGWWLVAGGWWLVVGGWWLVPALRLVAGGWSVAAALSE